MRVSIVGDSGAEVVGAPLGVAVGVAGAALGLAAVLSRPSSAPVLTKPHDAATASDPLAHSTFLEWGIRPLVPSVPLLAPLIDRAVLHYPPAPSIHDAQYCNFSI